MHAPLLQQEHHQHQAGLTLFYTAQILTLSVFLFVMVIAKV